MKKTRNDKGRHSVNAGQAAVELAVFGAILIFVLGTILRTAVSNGYAQNENFKAMRMAMLASWQGSKQSVGDQAPANTSHNTSAILFLEDRLSPDSGKYGNLDRSPYIAQGSGTFSYELMYPWQPGQDDVTSLIPIEDVWINGVHFPFSTASFVVGRTISRPSSCTYPANSCLQNQCLRNQREWVGGTVSPGQFQNVIPVAVLDSTTDATMAANGKAIYHELVNEGVLSVPPNLSSPVSTVNTTILPAAFTGWLGTTFPGTGQGQANQVQNILQQNIAAYKLFFTQTVNGTTQFSTTPSGSCTGSNNALCSTLELAGSTCPSNDTDANTGMCVNTEGYMQFDLKRNGDYSSVNNQFPLGGTLRNDIVWQWAATPATDGGSIGLDASNNQYPSYDIDGRLKAVTIYGLSQNPDGSPSVTYEDFQGGDIDNSWDSNSCGPKSGLLNDAEVFTFTKNGTFLKLREGKLFNPETDQYVRSVNKRDTIDVIQREIQLSNNTGRFCDKNGNLLATVNNDGVTPNPVEVCVAPNSGDNCFSGTNIARICYDEGSNIIFVRSRLEDKRGHFWMTNTSGQMKVQ